MAIGHRIKKAREEAGLSQRELAAKVGVTHGLVGQWESHTKKPGRENLRKIAEVTLTDPAVLLNEKPPSDSSVSVADPRALAMLRKWGQMSRRQQDNLLELMGVSADIRREIEKKREPAKG